MDFINNQIVSLNNDQPITRYIEAESNSSFNANMFNMDLWGYLEKAVLMGDNCGKLNIYNETMYGMLFKCNGNRWKQSGSWFN